MGTASPTADATPVSSRLTRASAFSYVCNRCLRCCYAKHIQTNPYEIARIARHQGVSTTECRERWTVDGLGTVLAQTATGACVFLGADGCTIHPSRPLVCRMYPLGRHVSSDGSERFSHAEPHPQTAGEYGTHGTIAEFLENQEVADLAEAADDYFRWFCRVLERVGDPSLGGELPEHASPDSPLRFLDLDLALGSYCAAHGIPEPAELPERRALHLKILYELLDSPTEGVTS
jgi:Fe-S-cluster containining protein